MFKWCSPALRYFNRLTRHESGPCRQLVPVLFGDAQQLASVLSEGAQQLVPVLSEGAQQWFPTKPSLVWHRLDVGIWQMFITASLP